MASYGRLAVALLLVLFTFGPVPARQSELQIQINKLVSACNQGDLQAVRRLLDAGTPVDGADENAGTPLMAACKRGHLDVIKFLLERGADLEAKTANGGRALTVATIRKRKELVVMLLERGANVNVAFEETLALGFGATYTPLMAAIARSDEELLKLLLEHASPRQRMLAAIYSEKGRWRAELVPAGGLGSSDAQRLLELAAKEGAPQTLRALLKLGAEADVPGQDGFTALATSVERGHLHCARVLLESGADSQLSSDLLVRALPHGPALVELLLAHGHDIDQTDAYGMTPLMWAVWTDQETTVQALLKAGASVDAVDFAGRSALSLAAERRRSFQSVAWLLEAGADLNLVDQRGYTPAMRLAWYGELDLLKRAKPAVADDGWTLAHEWLAYPGAEEVLKGLGCRLQAPDRNGWTPQRWVAHRQQERPLGDPEALLNTAWAALEADSSDASELALKGVARYRAEPEWRARFLYLLGWCRQAAGSTERAQLYQRYALLDTKVHRVLDFFEPLAWKQAGLFHNLRAVRALEDSCELARWRGEPKALLKSLTGLGTLNRRLSRYRESRVFLEEALTVAKSHRERAAVHRHLGATAQAWGRYPEALEHLARAEELLATDPKRLMVAEVTVDDEAKVWNVMGLVYSSLGQTEKAVELYRRILGQDFGSDLRGAALNNLGVAYLALGQPDGALRVFQESLELGNGEFNTAILKSNMARAQLASGQPRLALKLLDEVLRIQDKAEAVGAGARSLLTRSDVRQQLGDLNGALEDAQRSLAAGEKLENLSLQAAASGRLGRVLAAKGDSERALASLRRAVSLREEAAALGLPPEYRSGLLGSRKGEFELLLGLLVETQPAQAFEYSERARSRAVLDLLGDRRLSLRSQAPQALLERLDYLTAQLKAMRSRGQQEQRRARLRQEYVDTLEEVRRHSPELAATRVVEPPDLAVIQSSLGPETVLLEYYLGAKGSFAWLVSDQGIKAYRLAHTQDQFLEMSQRARDQMRVGRATRAVLLGESAKDDEGAALKELSTAVLGPIAEDLPEGSHLVVVPHGPLHYVPFGALPLADGEPLFSSFTLELAASAGTRLLSQQRELERGEGVALAALGDYRVAWDLPAQSSELQDGTARAGLAPLPGSRKEVLSLKKLYPDSRVLLGSEMTRQRLLSNIGQAQIVHLATHGILDGDYALFSGLALADDLATVSEIFEWQLKADLVVLSACDTGLGKLGTGDDMVGLTRAFQFAGARSVLASLWKVSDNSAAFWMESFHTHLKSGMEAHQAVRQAALDTRERYPQPRHWAPFVLYGSSRTSP